MQGSRRRGIPSAGYPVNATAGAVPDLAPYPQPPSGPGANPPATPTVTPLKEKARKEDATGVVEGSTGSRCTAYVQQR